MDSSLLPILESMQNSADVVFLPVSSLRNEETAIY